MTDWTTARIQDAERLASVLSEKLDDDAPLNLRTRWLPLAEELWRRITPVLDADGLPVVTTVGDLGNVHLGRRIKYEGPGGYGREGIYQGTTADYPERDRCNMHVGGGYEAGVPLDTPCEVLA